MQLPNKLMSGQDFKRSVVNTINALIDYLKTQRLVGDGKNIIVNQYTSGIGIQVRSQYNGGGGGGGEVFNHPFKLTIVYINGEPRLEIEEGRITITNNTQSRTYVSYLENHTLDLLPYIMDTGDYYVMLMIQYDKDGNGSGDNDYFPCLVYFVPADSLTNVVPATRGIYTTIIGKIHAEQVNQSTTYVVTHQNLISDLFLEFNSLNHPFSILASTSAFPEGEIIDYYTLTDFDIYVAGGKLTFDSTEYNISGTNLGGLLTDSYIYLNIEADGSSRPTIEDSDSILPYYDASDDTYHICLGYVSFDAQTFGIKIDQYIHDDVYIERDTYKVKTIENDGEPEYLSGKFTFDTPDSSNNFSSYSSTYIGGDTETSSLSPSGTSYKIKPVWLYKNINGYSSSDEQVLFNVNGHLKWDDAPSGGTGGDTYKVKITQADTADYLSNKVTSQNSSITITTVSSGISQQENFQINPAYFYSHDGSIGIASTNQGLDFTLSSHLVQVDSSDNNPDYLANKIDSTNDSLMMDVGNYGYGRILNLRINPDVFISSDGTVDIDATTEFEIDFSVPNLYKVKVDGSDSSPNYLDAKIATTSPLTKTKANNVLTLGLDLPAGDGLLAIKGGTLTIIPIGVGVAVGDGDTINWEEPVECDAAEPPQENNNNENNEE